MLINSGSVSLILNILLKFVNFIGFGASIWIILFLKSKPPTWIGEVDLNFDFVGPSYKRDFVFILEFCFLIS